MPISSHELQTDIEGRLAGPFPDVELLACEQLGKDRLRLVIDHPEGVTLALCERVTKELAELLNDFGLEVASPGPERPLTKPEHFRRFIGRHARVRTREPRDGQRSFTGELVGASGEEVTLAVPMRAGSDGGGARGGRARSGGARAGVVSIPFAEIHRSNLLSREEQE